MRDNVAVPVGALFNNKERKAANFFSSYCSISDKEKNKIKFATIL
jgi:hypothetical protein